MIKMDKETQALDLWATGVKPEDFLEKRLAQYPNHEDLELALSVIGDREELLDMGCAIGYTSLYFAERGKNVVAVEPSRQYVEAARQFASQRPEVAERIRFMQGDMDCYCPDPAQYGAALFLWSVFTELQTPKEQVRILQKYKKGLTNSGSGVLFMETVHIPDHPKPPFEMYDAHSDRRFLVNPDYSIDVVHKEGSHRIQCNTVGGWQQLFEQAGLGGIQTKVYDTPNGIQRVAVWGYNGHNGRH